MTDAPFRKDWLQNHAIVCYRFNSLGNEASEAWYHDVIQTYRDWPQGEPLRLLADLRASGSLPSPDIVQRVREVSQQVFPDFEGKVAFLLGETQDAKLLSLYLDRALAASRQRSIFTDETQAVNWLLD